ncbi:hypothetical protein CAMGR0001_1866 [Campylobacter gracilis RM3268]|uniref:Uncharacterized protein n=1 Tax=Campylobacter gracilis RM3268 TaxID=553220 RepID=C8PEG5_9BACT|nr:hypothetical protein CAMGR0001_1866 [Campylobacter gracilis RM3268]
MIKFALPRASYRDERDEILFSAPRIVRHILSCDKISFRRKL